MSAAGRGPGDDEDGFPEAEEPLVIEFGDTLDLHAFHPRDAEDLVQDWLDDCAAKGLVEIRVIHGKGVGVLREIARKVIERHPAVRSFGPDGGNWGATAIRLRPRPDRVA